MATASFPQLDVIAVGAHPDDVEIACGGTLASLVDAGHKVGIIDLTDGEPTPLSPGPDVRMAEAKAAGQALGVHLRTLLHLPNRRLFDSFEARVKLAIEFRKHRPRLVIGLGDRTPMASPDHWQAMQITDAAVFYSRLTKWDDKFDNLPPHVIGRQLYCLLGAPLGGARIRAARSSWILPTHWTEKLQRSAVTRHSFHPRRSIYLTGWMRPTVTWAALPASSRRSYSSAHDPW